MTGVQTCALPICADGYIANHPSRDQTFVDGASDRLATLRARKIGEPHPFIDRGTYIRYAMISVECIEAQEGWVRAGRPPVAP